MAYRTISNNVSNNVRLALDDRLDGEDYLPRKVFEPDPVWTGLYDQDGKPIYKVTDQIGFIRKDGNDGR
jgi:hypothetical protein